jgi:[acyl-carrier-protein] S-malonyltransferase
MNRRGDISSNEQKAAYVFPGQGSQWVGMGHYIHQTFPRARRIFEEADYALNFSISRLCFEGPEVELQQTINAQPAILTISVAYLKVLPELCGEDRPAPPSFVAGHSLGEFSALVAAEVLGFTDAIRLVRERGRLMHQVGQRTGGGMVAIIGLDETRVEEICREAGTQISNINSPGQIVVSGANQALTTAVELAESMGAYRTIPLRVSGAFHTALMEPAVEGLALFISGLTFRDPVIPVVANTTAQSLTTADEVKAELLRQLCHCIQWQLSVENMIRAGVRTFVEIGPGRVLSGLIKRVDRKVRIQNIGCMPDS